jgi:hypothetical protein
MSSAVVLDSEAFFKRVSSISEKLNVNSTPEIKNDLYYVF